MASTTKHFIGNRAPSLTYLVRTPNAVNPELLEPYVFPTGSSARFYLREVGTSTFRVNGQLATIVNPTATLPTDANAGLLRYDWAAPDVASPGGEFVGWFRITYQNGTTQDTPEFLFELTDHDSPTVAGLYTSPGALKDFSGYTEVKTASDEFLATNVIPRAEAWLQAWGPFTSQTCPNLKLAANILAEAIYLKVNPTGRNRAVAGGFKSESIGNYSYTLNDVMSGVGTAWDQLLEEIAQIVGPCMSGTTGEILTGGVDVFTPLPGYTTDPTGTAIETTFEVELEVTQIRGRLNMIADSWGWFR